MRIERNPSCLQWLIMHYLLDKSMDALQYKQVYLIGNIVILLYNGMAAFQYSEAVFGHIHYDVLDSLWVFRHCMMQSITYAIWLDLW